MPNSPDERLAASQRLRRDAITFTELFQGAMTVEALTLGLDWDDQRGFPDVAVIHAQYYSGGAPWLVYPISHLFTTTPTGKQWGVTREERENQPVFVHGSVVLATAVCNALNHIEATDRLD